MLINFKEEARQLINKYFDQQLSFIKIVVTAVNYNIAADKLLTRLEQLPVRELETVVFLSDLYADLSDYIEKKLWVSSEAVQERAKNFAQRLFDLGSEKARKYLLLNAHTIYNKISYKTLTEMLKLRFFTFKNLLIWEADFKNNNYNPVVQHKLLDILKKLQEPEKQKRIEDFHGGGDGLYGLW